MFIFQCRVQLWYIHVGLIYCSDQVLTVSFQCSSFRAVHRCDTHWCDIIFLLSPTLWVYNVHLLLQHKGVIHLNLILCCLKGPSLWVYNVHLFMQHALVIHLTMILVVRFNSASSWCPPFSAAQRCDTPWSNISSSPRFNFVSSPCLSLVQHTGVIHLGLI